jgi:predicted acetyltransferase
VVATFRSFATELTVPGGAFVPASAISGVTVLPTHRRRGLLRAMMLEELAAARGRGEPLAILVASEGSIYGRFRFGPATDAVGLELSARETRFAVEGRGEVALAEPEEFVAAAAAVYEAHRRATPGAIAREPHWWRAPAGLEPGWLRGEATTRLALVRDEGGGVTGYARWHVDDDWDGHRPRVVLTVDELFGADVAAEARLWRLVAGVDLVETVRAEHRGIDDALRWLVADPRGVRQAWRADWLWVRLLDVAAALSARAAFVAGSVVIEVEDDLGHAAGRFAWDGEVCAATDASPDMTLGVATLSACYLGGPSVRTLAAVGLAHEHRPGAVAELDRMLRSDVAPWCATMF